jgi:Protein of unknown function (Hypoth_ymh)
VDTTWAKQQLTHFLQLTEPRRPPPTPGILDMTGRTVTAATNEEIIPAAQIVEQILDRVLVDWRSAQPERMSNRWIHHRETAQRALAQLERDDEIRERLGDAAPQKVNAEIQNKLARRDIAETALFREAFTPDSPQPGRPRLRLSQDDGSQSFRSLHRGVMAFAEGCYAALRNPGSHAPQDDLPEDEALERLAAFSVLARWVDQAAIER